MKFALLLLSISIFGTQTFAQDASTTPAAGPATAATVSTPVASTTDTTTTSVSASEGKKGDPKIIKMIEDKFKLSAEDIAKYRAEKLGYGQIMLMAEFSKASGKTMDEVVALFKEKKSVKEVAKELKLTKEDLDKIKKDMKPVREEKKEKRKEDKKEDRK
ncbi:MAG: hypothetical protein H7281_04865, partial [Bacteriovorax sp.]|nr:hypothetical protein [Bacteriovorax sp.]